MNKKILLSLPGVALINFAAAVDTAVIAEKSAPLWAGRQMTQQQTGATVLIPACLAQNVVFSAIPAAPTPATLAELLGGYNFAAVWDANRKLISVLVSGRVGRSRPACSGDDHTVGKQPTHPVDQATEQLLHYEAMPLQIPARYREMPAGTVNPVSLPIEELNRMELGERLELSLPAGQFGFILENRFEHASGDVTWVGYLEGTDSSDRVLITGGSAGTVGQVITPEVTYSIEFEMERSWLVETTHRPPHATQWADDADADLSLRP